VWKNLNRSLLPCVWESSSLTCLCTLVVFQLLIVIMPWFLSFVISSSPASITSLSLPYLPFQYRKCTESPLQVEVHEIIFPMSHHSHETGSEQESCAYFTPVMQSVQSRFQTV
jgi:hypothetical protein